MERRLQGWCFEPGALITLFLPISRGQGSLSWDRISTHAGDGVTVERVGL